MSAPAAPVRTTVVGLGTMAVSTDACERLITYALGSCLGVALYDPLARVGGLAHVMMPSSTMDPERARESPLAFVDSGVPALFRECYRAGAAKDRLLVKVAGGATTAAEGDADQFQIGKRNLLMLRRLLWRNEVLIHAHDVGGVRISRTMTLAVASGDVMVRANGVDRRL